MGFGFNLEELDALLGFQTALRAGGEGADRFDFVAEEFEADGVGRVRGEDVADAAAATEFAGILHGLDALVAVIDEPARECRADR